MSVIVQVYGIGYKKSRLHPITWYRRRRLNLRHKEECAMIVREIQSAYVMRSYMLQKSDTKKGTLMSISIPWRMAMGIMSLPE